MPPPPSPPNNIKNVVVSKHLSQQVKVYSYRVHKIQHCWRRRGKELSLSPIVLSAPLTFDLVCSLLLLSVYWYIIYPSFITRSEEEADENKEGGSPINLVASAVECCFEDSFDVYSESLAWSSSEDNGWDRLSPGELPFVCRPVLGLDGPGKDKFLLSEESIQRLRHVTLKDPKRKSLRRRRRHVTTHETLCRYVIAADTTASDYLDTLSRITTGTWCESGDFAKPSRYPCNRSTNVDEGLSLCCCCCCCFDCLADFSVTIWFFFCWSIILFYQQKRTQAEAYLVYGIWLVNFILLPCWTVNSL